MVSVSVCRFSRFITRNIRSSLRASVRHYDTEPGGEELKSATVTMLSKQDDDYLYVESYSPVGFRLNNGFRIIGPCVLFPRSLLHWAIGSVEDLNEASLSLFTMLVPKPDVLVLGIGDHGVTYDKNIIKFLRSKKLNVEILPTDQACSTFNFLNSERRVVAAALIPPSMIEVEDDDELRIQAQIMNEENVFKMQTGYGENPFANVPGEYEEELKRVKKFYKREVKGVNDKLGLDEEQGRQSSGKKAGEERSDSSQDGKER